MFKKKIKGQTQAVASKKPIVKGKKNIKKVSYTGSALVIVIILLISSVIALILLYSEYVKLEDKLTEHQNISGLSDETGYNNADLLTRVSRHMRLPDGNPQIATVANIDNLVKQQPFFKGAKNGDRVLIYPDKVIVYDEQNDIIVNVGFLLNDAASATSTSATSTAEIFSSESKGKKQEIKKLTVEVRNGSNIRGLASKNKSLIMQDDGFIVTGVANAARNNYKNGMIIDLSDGSKQELVKKLSDLLTLPVVKDLPKGEVGSPAEVVVIVTE